MLAPYYMIKNGKLETLHVFKTLPQAQDYLHENYKGTLSHEGATLTTYNDTLYLVHSSDTPSLASHLALKHLDPQQVAKFSEDFQINAPSSDEISDFATEVYARKIDKLNVETDYQILYTDEAQTLFGEIVNDLKTLADFWSK